MSFPVMYERNSTPGPTTIPWTMADRAYSIYSARYGKEQSLERIAERGGFGAGELDEFIPGWREELSELAALRAGPWYLLYGGISADWQGPGRYVGRTVDPTVAKAHYDSCRKDPYSTGSVLIVTDDSQEHASSWTEWGLT